ncbi:hypothetical protein EVAR_46313_1 [Eumeta japonica]|uniref:Uncharacterized protein n=1 Tax=Eumeta variegata TaxID=151549 RepID=A0A4C1XY61_EUMVA|nr:hypothetical protein EVAR_46313_1 [Eumeta japonica]
MHMRRCVGIAGRARGECAGAAGVNDAACVGPPHAGIVPARARKLRVKSKHSMRSRRARILYTRMWRSRQTARHRRVRQVGAVGGPATTPARRALRTAPATCRRTAPPRGEREISVRMRTARAQRPGAHSK